MKIGSIARRITKQFLNDKRSLAMLFLAPVIILWLFSIILTSGNTDVKIGIVNVSPSIEDLLGDNEAFVSIDQLDEAEQQLHDKQIDAYLTIDEQQNMYVKLEGTSVKHNQEILRILNKIMNSSDQAPIRVAYLFGEDGMTTFDATGPAFLGFFAFFFVFILGGIAFVRERITGTLERILVSPIKRFEIVFGYLLGFAVVAVIQSIIIAFMTTHILGMYNVGSLFDVIVVTALISLTALTIGMVLSTFAYNEFQVIQFIPVIVVPQVFFAGIFPTDGLPKWFLLLGNVYPLTHGAKLLNNIMIRGQVLQDNISNILILLMFCLIFVSLNILLLKLQRKY